jgi:hypothetical protein
MQLDIEVWLRGDDFATTQVVEVSLADPPAWSDSDVRLVLEELLRAIDRAKHPEKPTDRPVTLRGFSWIVNRFETGVLLSVEIQLGAAAAGPFSIDQQRLESMVGRVIAAPKPTGSPRVH